MLYYKIINVSDLSEDDIRNTFDLLSKEQLDYIGTLCEKRRIQSVAVRTALHLLINEYKLNISVSSLAFNKSNKPYFIGSNLHLSFSHSDEYVACAVADAPVGIDIEKIKPVKDSVIKRVCSLDEQNYINNSNSSFFTVWTLKEAYIKANDCSLKMSQINTVEDGNICMASFDFLTRDIPDYKWSIIKKQH